MQRFFKVQDIDIWRMNRNVIGHCEGDAPSLAALGCPMYPRMIDEYAANGLGGDAEKMGPILPDHSCLIGKFQKRFVSQGGGLQRVVWPFVAQVRCRQSL